MATQITHRRYKVETTTNKNSLVCHADMWRLFAAYPNELEALYGAERAAKDYPNVRIVTEIYVQRIDK